MLFYQQISYHRISPVSRTLIFKVKCLNTNIFTKQVFIVWGVVIVVVVHTGLRRIVFWGAHFLLLLLYIFLLHLDLDDCLKELFMSQTSLSSSSSKLTMAAATLTCFFHGYTLSLPPPAWIAVIWFLVCRTDQVCDVV